MTRDPHASQTSLFAGKSPKEAAVTLVLVHGRGGSAGDMLSLYAELRLAALAGVALQAAGGTWYPNSFLAPLESNQPWLDSALMRIDAEITGLIGNGISGQQIAILGFSQGACLTLEYAARHPRRFAAIIAFTGGLIGPPGTPRNYSGSLDATPIFLGTSDPDPHVPFQRVEETAAVLANMHAVVDLRRYNGMPHTINHEELDAARSLLAEAIDLQSSDSNNTER
jgi:predicted esterase